jgi:hypothetical protein
MTAPDTEPDRHNLYCSPWCDGDHPPAPHGTSWLREPEQPPAPPSPDVAALRRFLSWGAKRGGFPYGSLTHWVGVYESEGPT